LAASADAGLSAAPNGIAAGLTAATDSRGRLAATAYDGWLSATAVNNVSHGIFLLFKLLLIYLLICRLLRLSTGLSSAITLHLTLGVGN